MCINLQFQIDPVKAITTACTALKRPIQYLRDPEPRITQLTDDMNQLQSKSDDIEHKIDSDDRKGLKPTREVQDWLTKVRIIAYKVSVIQTDHRNGSFRWGINRRAEYCLAWVAVLHKDSVFDTVAIELPPKGVQEIPAEPPVATLTMSSYLSELQNYLEEKASTESQQQACLQQNSYGIIGIWGMGGVGKTTLLQSLNNKLLRASEAGESPPMFDHVIWAVASKDYSLGKLQRDIAKRLRLPLCNEGEYEQAMYILNFLENKSFLLLLDDLWGPVDLAQLGIPRPLCDGATNQKVVFTTRWEDVCGLMQPMRQMKLECLKEEEALQLFETKVGEETLQAHTMIPRLARQVAKECDGLPLALAVIGSAMRAKKTPKQWQNAITLLQMSRSYEIHGLGDKILPTLKFSYDMLHVESINIKKCFLLCSSWPEGRSILKTDLIECWMGHGLVDEGKFDNINEAFDSGHELIGVLQAACLLERGNDGDREVKMHDMVRDLALWISSDCGKNPNKFIVLSHAIASEDSQREAERISLVRSTFRDTSCLPANCAKLETLMVLESHFFSSIVTGFFEGTPALIYLDLSYTAISDLPQQIGLLRNLRYLNLSFTRITLLPTELGNLRELRFLLLRELESIDIPQGLLEKFVRLSVIDMTGTLCKNWLELSNLRRPLKGVGIDLWSIEGLNQLAQMQNVLTWRLGLWKLTQLDEPAQSLSLLCLGSSSIRSSIQMLKIELCERLEMLSMESDGDGGTQNWCLSRLEEVDLRSLPKLEKIVWRGVSPAVMLPSLTVLRICDCPQLSNISWVIRLQSLEDLTVLRCSKMEQIIDDNDDEIRDDGVAFPSLRRLSLRNLSSLKMFGERSLAFPSLEVLRVSFCPKMKTLPFKAEMAGRKLKEIWGERVWWEELVMDGRVKDALLPRFKPVQGRVTGEIIWSEPFM